VTLVVLTRERGYNDDLRSLLPRSLDVREVPLTTTRFFSPEDVQVAIAATPVHGTYRFLVVTSARSSKYAAFARDALADDARTLAVGRSTQVALEKYGVVVDGVTSGGALGLADAVDAGPVLEIGALSPRRELSDELHRRGIDVTYVACYDTEPLSVSDADARLLRRADVVFIGAPSAWQVARSFVPESAVVFVPGSTTANEVRLDHERVLEGWGPDAVEQLRAM
jgi:uroporphyrinogen-III synthase